MPRGEEYLRSEAAYYFEVSEALHITTGEWIFGNRPEPCTKRGNYDNLQKCEDLNSLYQYWNSKSHDQPSRHCPP